MGLLYAKASPSLGCRRLGLGHKGAGPLCRWFTEGWDWRPGPLWDWSDISESGVLCFPGPGLTDGPTAGGRAGPDSAAALPLPAALLPAAANQGRPGALQACRPAGGSTSGGGVCRGPEAHVPGSGPRGFMRSTVKVGSWPLAPVRGTVAASAGISALCWGLNETAQRKATQTGERRVR